MADISQMESVPTARAVRRLDDILRQRVIPRLCVIFARPNPLLVLRYTTQHPWEHTVLAFVWKSRNSLTRRSDIPVRVIAARCNRRMENLYRRPSSSIGNRDFDKANWLNLGQALGRDRVDQQALWSRMAGGALSSSLHFDRRDGGQPHRRATLISSALRSSAICVLTSSIAACCTYMSCEQVQQSRSWPTPAIVLFQRTLALSQAQ